MVEENLLETVVDRIGGWDIEWIRPVEAACRPWADVSKHRSLAASVQSILSDAALRVYSGLEATEINASASDGIAGGKRRIDQ